jgi:hypothetical protein
MIARHLTLSLIIIVCTAAGLAQSAKVEPIGAAPSALPSEVRTALSDKGCRVTLDDGWEAELWLAKDLKLTPKESAGALYPELSNSEFIGVINLPKGMSDFRGQAVPAGAYTLRYQLLPADANHLGVATNPDFVLAIPVDSDTKPDVQFPFDKLVARSMKTTGVHPAVIAMDKAGDPGTAIFNDQKMLVVTAAGGGAKPEKLGIVLKGQAAQ